MVLFRSYVMWFLGVHIHNETVVKVEVSFTCRYLPKVLLTEGFRSKEIPPRKGSAPNIQEKSMTIDRTVVTIKGRHIGSAKRDSRVPVASVREWSYED